MLYKIKLSRLQRFLGANVLVTPDSLEITEIQSLEQDAQQLAQQGDYDLAVEILEEALIYVNQETAVQNPQPGTQQQLSKVHWDFIAIAGDELWQQKYGLVFTDKDSVVLESSSNPFIGLQIMLDAGTNSDEQYQAQLEGKFSDEYNSGRCMLSGYRRFNSAWRAVARNTLEGTYYKREIDWRYMDERLETTLYGTLVYGSILEIRNDLQLRRYVQESDFFSNYVQNQSRLGITMSIPNIARIEITGDYRLRHYGITAYYNYNEYAGGLNFWPKLPANYTLSNRTQFRDRQYKFGYIDSLFTNDFREITHYSNLRYHFANRSELNCEFGCEARDYVQASVSMPNYFDYYLEPAFSCELIHFITFRAGYRFRKKLHYLTADESASLENFYTHGPVFSLDFFLVGNLMASVSNTWQVQRYPNYNGYDETGFTLYSNRDINSFFLYLSWNVNKNWQIDSMGMLDFDRDISVPGANTNSNLFNFELSYKL